MPRRMTFEEYKKLWDDSGKMEDKVNGRGGWHMDRINVNEGYKVGNIQIIDKHLNVELWYARDRWNIGFKWRERFKERNGVDECPF